MTDNHLSADPGALSPARAWVLISGLGLTVFIFVTTSLMPMGLLPDIALGLNRSEAFTGLIVTGYAWVAALLTLPLTMLLARVDRRLLLMGVLTLFVISHGLAAAAPDFAFLLSARALTASAHAVLWGLATPLAVSLAPREQSAKALAVMATGVSLSSVVGVPLGTWLGQLWGWRTAFLAVGLVGLILMIILAALLPRRPSDNDQPLKNLSTVSGRRPLWRVYALVALTLGGHAAAFTYFTPFMRSVGGYSPPEVVNFLLLFGLAGIAGSFLTSLVTDRWNTRATIFILAALTLNLALANWSAASGLAGSIGLCLLWGSLLSGAGIVYQTAIFKIAPEATDLVMALYAVFFNLGLGGGAIIGGRLYEHFSIGAVTWGGAVFLGLALALAFRSRKL